MPLDLVSSRDSEWWPTILKDYTLAVNAYFCKKICEKNHCNFFIGKNFVLGEEIEFILELEHIYGLCNRSSIHWHIDHR